MNNLIKVFYSDDGEYRGTIIPTVSLSNVERDAIANVGQCILAITDIDMFHFVLTEQGEKEGDKFIDYFNKTYEFSKTNKTLEKMKKVTSDTYSSKIYKFENRLEAEHLCERQYKYEVEQIEKEAKEKIEKSKKLKEEKISKLD